jgi:hypothetical protein
MGSKRDAGGRQDTGVLLYIQYLHIVPASCPYMSGTYCHSHDGVMQIIISDDINMPLLLMPNK